MVGCVLSRLLVYAKTEGQTSHTAARAETLLALEVLHARQTERWNASKIDVGSTFTLRLPLHAEHARRPD